ncbi:hypothetical protein MOUN0_L01376 [Monosporozyma unispora]|nr:Required for respiratory growth protein 7, mitochondrial [Kazachstania unispora]
MKWTPILRQLKNKSLYDGILTNFVNENQNIINSTVFQGNLYEYTVMREIHDKLFMDEVSKVGGAHDGGVDITAKWDIHKIREKVQSVIDLNKLYPQNSIPTKIKLQSGTVTPLIHKLQTGDNVNLDVLVQCKAFNKSKVTPKEFRELIGTFNSMVPRRKWKSSVMIMCSPHLLTPDGLKLINNINISLIYLRIGQLNKKSDDSFDLVQGGKLLNYYENDTANKLLLGCGINECLKLGLNNNDE